MEDSWLCIEDDDSNPSASDSDAIDSETEAELYSTIHYEENLNSHKTESEKFLTSEIFDNSSPRVLLTPVKDNFCSEEKTQNVKFQSMNTFKAVSNICDNYFVKNRKSSDRCTFLNNQLNKDQIAAEEHEIDIQKLQGDNLNLNGLKGRDLNKSSEVKSSSNVQNEMSVSSSNINQSLQKIDNTIVVDSSDSDCDIWTEVNSLGNSSFETNLKKNTDTIYLSSSDSAEELSTSLKGRESVLKNLSMPNIKIGEQYKGQWYINDEDLYRKRKNVRRYHGTIDITCSHCNRKGHSVRNCPVPKKVKCFICGGAHRGYRCMNKMCSNCSGYGHDSRNCQMRPNSSFCLICSVKGHTDQNCPDLWRRYHLTTNHLKIIKGKPLKQDTMLYCWNCGGHGHYGSICKTKISGSLTTRPCVISYNNPEGLLRKRLRDAKTRREQYRWDEHLMHRGDLNVTFNNLKRRKNVNFFQRNQLNTGEIIGKKGAKKKRTKKNDFKPKEKLYVQFKKKLDIPREGDFPRTPKTKKEYKSEVPESVELMMKKRLKTQARNRRRKNQKQRNLKGVAYTLQEM